MVNAIVNALQFEREVKCRFLLPGTCEPRLELLSART